MGNQADASTQDNAGATETFADKVNVLVDKLVKDEKGSWSLPEGTEVDDATHFAVIAERRRRDTQSEYTKMSQKAKALEAEKAKLFDRAVGDVSMTLTPEQKEELEDLKFSDPEEWRKRINTLEKESRTKRSQEIEEELKQVSTSTLKTSELERRTELLSTFNSSHPDFPIDDDVIANDIPPRITKKLETGQITFEAFLHECYDYAKKGKIVKDTVQDPDMPNMSKAAGGSMPDKEALKKHSASSYEKETY